MRADFSPNTGSADILRTSIQLRQLLSRSSVAGRIFNGDTEYILLSNSELWKYTGGVFSAQVLTSTNCSINGFDLQLPR